MFFDGYADKGLCAAGGSHEGHGDDPRTFNFVLAHPVHPSISLQAVQRSNGRFIIVQGTGFTPNSGATVYYDIADNVAPTTHTTGEENAETNVNGEFISEIEVRLATDIGGVGVRVRDNVTGTDTNASLG
jgi:hypothetical protein